LWFVCGLPVLDAVGVVVMSFMQVATGLARELFLANVGQH
jgi:hypothetical protein